MDQVLKTARDQGVLDHPRPERVAWTPTRTTPAGKRAQDAPKAKNLPDGHRQVVLPDPGRGEGQVPDRPDRRRRGRRPGRARALGREARRDGPQPASRPGRRRPTCSRSTRRATSSATTARRSGTCSKPAGSTTSSSLGVHTNMCVLGRPFGLRQMAKNGKNVVLMRDMTDTMYNPRALALRQPLRRHRPDRRAHREVRLPDDHQRPDPRRQARSASRTTAGRTSSS